jgi:hypothetical protein
VTDSPDRVRERLGALSNTQISEADLIKLVTDLLNAGGGVSLEIDEIRVKVVRREGHFVIKDGRIHSTVPPRIQRGR